jgi:hypothetical protein
MEAADTTETALHWYQTAQDDVAMTEPDSSETALHWYQTTQHHILDDSKPCGHCHKNLKSQQSQLPQKQVMTTTAGVIIHISHCHKNLKFQQSQLSQIQVMTATARVIISMSQCHKNLKSQQSQLSKKTGHDCYCQSHD